MPIDAQGRLFAVSKDGKGGISAQDLIDAGIVTSEGASGGRLYIDGVNGIAIRVKKGEVPIYDPDELRAIAAAHE